MMSMASLFTLLRRRAGHRRVRSASLSMSSAGMEEMYPAGAVTFVTTEGISDRLDGRSRPGHFRGVTTVVAKLFHIVEPDAAFFGQKDAAQIAIIQRMVRDLVFPVAIVVAPTIREPDGMALSSRNAYLSPGERRQATVLSRALREAERREWD